MTPTYKEATLTEIRDILLRIERLLTREADNATVEFYRKLLEEKAKAKRQPDPFSMPIGMPDPPLPKVQTTWQTPPPGGTYEHGGWIHRDGFSMVGP